MAEFSVTPYEVQGTVDYGRLIQQFGLMPLDDATLKRLRKHAGELHYLLRRKIFFSHRDLGWLLNEFEKGNKFFLYTGRAPSGPIHLGHLVPWIFTKWLQDKFGAELWFQFPDEEKFLFKDNLTLEDTARYTRENMRDVIALGFDPQKTHFLVDTMHAGLMYKEACKVAKLINFSTVKATFGFTNQTNIGSIFYTAMQAVPAFLPSVLAGKNVPCLIPLGADQDVHFRVARDAMGRLGYFKPAILHCQFLPALTGPDSKMSSSAEHTAVYTTDDAKTVATKIKKYAFSGGRATVDEHRKLGGNPDVDVSYQWLRFLEPDDAKLQKIYEQYTSGTLLSGELKEILIETINAFLKSHQKKRAAAEKIIDKFIFPKEGV